MTTHPAANDAPPASATRAQEQEEAVVALHDVSVIYNRVAVLDAVTLSIARGEFLAVIGPNGSGKTTLLRTITGVVAPDAGTVRVFGRPADALGRLRHRIGYLPQMREVNARVPLSAYQVVLMGRFPMLGPLRFPGRADRRRAMEAMERVGVADLAGAPFRTLSGGQQQRVFLARALVNGPQLLLLDEPTTGVDVTATEQFYALLQQLHGEGATIVIVSHDVGVVASVVDRVACLNRHMVAHGVPGAVLTGETLESMYGCDAVFLEHGKQPHLVVRQHHHH